jgi:MFS family permease
VIAPGQLQALAAGFAVLFVASGVNFAFGVLFKPILGEFGVDRSTLALAATASFLVSALSQPAFGGLVDRFGPRRVILASMALMTLGTALVSQARGPWQFIALYGVAIAVAYTGCGILAVSIHVRRWFPGERGFVSTLVACGFSFGYLALTQVAARSAAAAGWRQTYLLLAGILAVALGVFVFALRDAPPGFTAPGDPAPRRAPSPGTPPRPPVLERRAALRTPAFWAMTVGLMGCGFTDFLMTTHLAPYATDLGMTSAVAANAISILAAANVAGLLAAGTVAAGVGTRAALVLTYSIRAAAFLYLPLVGEPWQLYLFAGLFGATFFTTAPLSSTLVGQLFGPTHHGALFGVANLCHGVAGALGAYAGGLVFDVAGSYRPIFLLAALVVVGSAGVTSFARETRARR